MSDRASILVLVRAPSGRIHHYGPFDNVADAESSLSVFDNTDSEARIIGLGMAWDAAVPAKVEDAPHKASGAEEAIAHHEAQLAAHNLPKDTLGIAKVRMTKGWEVRAITTSGERYVTSSGQHGAEAIRRHIWHTVGDSIRFNQDRFGTER